MSADPDPQPAPKTLARIGGMLLAVCLLSLYWWLWADLLNSIWSARDGEVIALAPHQATVLSFLATSVGTGTAAVLGISIVELKTDPAKLLMFDKAQSKVGVALREYGLLAAGIISCLVISFWMIVTWYFKAATGPELIPMVGANALGWLAGGFSAVFKAGDSATDGSTLKLDGTLPVTGNEQPPAPGRPGGSA